MCSLEDVILKRKTIKITHIESPHKFWFKYTDNTVSNDKINDLENRIAQYAEDYQCNNNLYTYVPKLNSIVAIFSTEWNKWIRAKVSDIDENTVGEMRIFVWSIDHGRKVETEVEFMVPILDEDLINAPITSVCVGGLFGIMPAIQVC